MKFIVYKNRRKKKTEIIDEYSEVPIIAPLIRK